MLPKQLLVVIGLLLLLPFAYAAKPPVFSTDDGAIRGYDPVAYFTESQPAMGSTDYTFEWMGQTFKFASAENRALFEANPETYAPRLSFRTTLV